MTEVECRKLETSAQEAAERRLAACTAILYEDEREEEEEVDGELANEQPAGPYCGCDTCIVREVLDAAWPFMVELARADVSSRAAPLERLLNSGLAEAAKRPLRRGELADIEAAVAALREAHA
jgi:hypothetical protein